MEFLVVYLSHTLHIVRAKQGNLPSLIPESAVAMRFAVFSSGRNGIACCKTLITVAYEGPTI